MTFLDMQNRVHATVKRDDLVYADFVNDALLEIQLRRNWSCMRTRGNVTLTAGNTSVPLPADFKEIQNVKPAITLLVEDPDNPDVEQPCQIVSEQSEIVRNWTFGVVFFTTRVWLNDEILDSDGSSVKTLNILVPFTNDTEFVIRYYKIYPNLVDPTATSPFFDQYPGMVEYLAKRIAFTKINDPAADSAEAAFAEQFNLAVRYDAYKDVAGRANHM